MKHILEIIIAFPTALYCGHSAGAVPVMRPRGEKFPCALAVRRAGAIGDEPCGGVAGGRGESAAGRDLLRLLSSSLFSSVDEVDDHSMLSRRRVGVVRCSAWGMNRGEYREPS